MVSQPTPALQSLIAERDALSPIGFRWRLREHLLTNPQITIQQVASSLGVTRQRVSWLVGPLGRPACCAPGPRSAPRREQAAARLADLRQRVAEGESADSAAKGLGISLAEAWRLGFRAKEARPVHGTWERAKVGCNCWKCRRVAGVAQPRSPRMTPSQIVGVHDWLAWSCPDSGVGLSQVAIGKLAGVGQGAVSRAARQTGVVGKHSGCKRVVRRGRWQ